MCVVICLEDQSLRSFLKGADLDWTADVSKCPLSLSKSAISELTSARSIPLQQSRRSTHFLKLRGSPAHLYLEYRILSS